ncbi:unnamed protein product [Rhizoctonia solani]|uniref:Uncharacterized protein n=1 Tax=Rhizoctonia solani TaxID=456999 RepID=A0A8H3GP90_9AGAM|nr:unnamed protein product [Rhizoctonia solani]
MVVFVISGASYGLGLELVRQASHDDRNTVFALVKSAKAAERLAGFSSTRDNVHVYFESQEDRQAGYEIIARDMSRTVSCVDILLHNVAWLGDCPGMQNFPRSDHQPNQINDLQKFFSNHVLDTIQITNAFIPLFHRGSLKKVVTITSDQTFDSHSSGFDMGIAYAMVKAALGMAVLRYSAIPELQRKGLICATIECGPLDNSEQETQTDEHFEQIQKYVGEIFETMERLKRDYSGQCVKLRERDLITF